MRTPRSHPFDVRELATPEGTARVLAWAQAHANTTGYWYLNAHTHRCACCGCTRTHTGLEVARLGDTAAHTCCGTDVRGEP